MNTDRITAAQALAWARAHGAITHLVDGTDLRTSGDAVQAIGCVLDCPQRHGASLDALFDCLGDLSWLPPGEHVLVWANHQVLAAADWPAYQQVRAVLERRTTRRLTVLFTTG